MPTIEETIAFIRTAHEGQTDKAGAPYWRHPVSVMERLGPEASEDDKLAALLHDVMEDTHHSADDLRARGYSEAVIDTVRLLTKPKGVPYLDCIRAIAESGNVSAIRIKIADNEDNSDPARVALLPPEQRGGQERYAKSLAILRAALAALQDQSSRR
jgi:(p)ppGpp synthase/HD superfamily hydrolase